MAAENVGPENPNTGDPEWIEPTLAPGGAYPGDVYLPVGRWKERIFPQGAHLADKNALTVGHVGLRSAMVRLREALYPADTTQAPQLDMKEVGAPNADPIIRAMVAVYDALEWVHSLDEHLRKDGVYRSATDIDSWAGEFVVGACAARNASHHGLRRVVGKVDVARPFYRAVGARWVRTDEVLPDETFASLRWVEKLPPRPESSEQGKPALFSAHQVAAYEQHLAGRDVYNTLMVCWAFFRHRAIGEPMPSDVIWGPASLPANIDPESPAAGGLRNTTSAG